MNRGPKELKLGMQDKLFMMKMLVRSDVASEAMYRDRLKLVLQQCNSSNKIHQTWCTDFS